MPIPLGVRLGPLSKIVSRGACWDDEYPAWQAYADELEALCSFLTQSGQFERFLPRLQARKKERDSALNEIRVALHLQSSGFPVVDWEPPGQGKSTGEFLVAAEGAQRIFVEVKGPTWEAELSQGERSSGRTREPKYINGKGGAFDNSKWIQFAVRKAYPKFGPDLPNLLVITDDLFVSLQHGTDMFAKKALYETKQGGYFALGKCERLGGVGIFWNEVIGLRVGYNLRLYANPHVLPTCRLPNGFVKAWIVDRPDSICSLEVESEPPGADVELDGRFVGNSPTTLRLKPGEYTITLRKAGYVPWIRKTTAIPNNQLKIMARLEKEQ